MGSTRATTSREENMSNYVECTHMKHLGLCSLPRISDLTGGRCSIELCQEAAKAQAWGLTIIPISERTKLVMKQTPKRRKRKDAPTLPIGASARS